MRDASGTQAALSTLFVFYLLSFLGCLLYAILRVPNLLPIFRWRYIWANALVLFVDWAIPVTVAGLAAAYSLFLRRGRVREAFHRLVSSQLTLLVVLAILYSVVLLGFYPRSSGLMRELTELSSVAEGFREEAKKAASRGEQAKGLEYYERYLAINPQDQGVQDLHDELLRSMAGSPEAKPKPTARPERRAKDLATGKSAYELLRLAQEFFEAGDWFSAHYYATQAASVQPDREDAKRLAARAWQKIASREFSSEEKEEAAFYRSKVRGYQLYQDKDYISAYYHFLELRKRRPEDPDVVRFLDLSREEVVRETYFLEDAQAAELLPGTQDLLFLNPREDGTRELVSIARMSSGPEGTFFRGIEVVRFGGGAAPYHFRAPYGKLKSSEAPAGEGRTKPPVRQDILLHGIAKQDRARELLPQILSGAQRPESRERRYLLPIRPAREELEALLAPGSPERNNLAAVSLAALWQARSNAGAYGQIEAFLSQEILMRLLLPFAFLNLGLLAMSVGWSYRFVSLGRPPLAAYLVLPVFVAAASLLASLYLKAHRIALGFALLAWGFRPALVGLAVLEGAVLALMLVLLAGQKVE